MKCPARDAEEEFIRVGLILVIYSRYLSETVVGNAFQNALPENGRPCLIDPASYLAEALSPPRATPFNA